MSEQRHSLLEVLPPGIAHKPAGEPDRPTITFTVDGAVVQAPDGIMLVEAAKYGGVEIPVFCYEPKLGPPVGACRMCLVEIEGIPKLQTACSTPVRDGMSVITRSPRVIEAQNSVVEFILANHPLDCPVCDKGGECPLQDISYGWGRGESRFTEPKRHFEKPIALSPSIAIDRERCILCYRCVRFSQEVSEDSQLVLLERGASTYVGTFDGNPYIAPFSGNIIELCPVGALTSRAYRFRARPWDIEQGGSVCTLCPAQCNVSYTVRDERVMRVAARDNAGVDDGWLCDKGRFAFQSWQSDARITQPHLRQGDKLRPASWESALDAAAAALRKAGTATAALAGGAATNEEGWLLRHLMHEALGSPHLDSRRQGRIDPAFPTVLARPEVTASVPDVEWAEAILVLDTELVDDMPILDLRVRKAVRRNRARLAVATARPSTLDGNAHVVARYAPGHAEAFVQALLAALGDQSAGPVDDLAARAGATVEDVRAIAATLDSVERVVLLWSEHMTLGERGRHAVRAVCNLIDRLGLADVAGAGHMHAPLSANQRGLREIGVLPNLDPGLRPSGRDGKCADEMRDALAAGELGAAILLGVDPAGTWDDRARWRAALAKAPAVIGFTSWLDDGVAEHADVVFPAEVAPEKEGTITHPDGRLQRLRQTVRRAGEVRAGWWVLAELARRLGADPGVRVVHQATARYVAATPIYAGITPDEIGGAGVRWQDRESAAKLPPAERTTFELETPPAAPPPNGRLRTGTFRPLWSGPEVANAPTLRGLATVSRVELSPVDGRRLGVATGDEVTVRTADRELTARVALRDAIPAGTAFLLDDGTAAAPAAPGPQLVEVVK